MKNIIRAKIRRIKKLPVIIVLICIVITSIFLYNFNTKSLTVMIANDKNIFEVSKSTTVNDILNEFENDVDKKEKEYNSKDIIVSANGKKIDEEERVFKYDKIKIDFYTSKIEEETVEIKYESIVTNDDSKDTNYYEVVKEGKNGSKKLVYATDYKNGKVVKSRYLKSEKVVDKVVNEEVVVGTKSVVNTSTNNILIVNKKHPLSSSYAPGENAEAKSNFIGLVTDMSNLGFSVSTTNYSGYRSYEKQSILYNNYVASDGVENANRYSAKPGYSEHQTGLAFDIINLNSNLLGQDASDASAVSWLANNAHKYGFIIRYLEGKEHITGYMYEPWHVRYVGVADATKIYKSNLTLEEYLGVEGGDYE